MNGPTPPREPDHDEALERLRAADPARGLEPDLAHLRSAVDARLAAPSARPVDELALRRVPRRWFAVAAVAAGALVVGGTGFGLGSITAGGRPADRVITLAEGSGASGATGESGAAETGDRAATDDALIYPPWGGRTVFTASGLSDATGSAPVYTLDAESAFSKETAERVARALGLDGEATKRFGSWVIGDQDGRGPSLTLSPDGQASVSYYDPTKDPYLCGTAAARQDAASSGIRCAPPAEGSAPRGEAAAARMRELLTAMGIRNTVEIEATLYDVPENGGPRMTTVTAHLVLGGQRAGVTWSATLVANGVQSFYGPTAPLVPLGEYAVVSENDAVRRLGDPRFGPIGGPVIAFDTADAAREAGSASGGRLAEEQGAPDEQEMTGGGTTDDVGGGASGAPDTAIAERIDPALGTRAVPEPTDEGTPPPTPEPGEPIPWPVTEVVITKARLGLAQHVLPDGASVLLPAYELADADGRTWSVLAVADGELDFSEPE